MTEDRDRIARQRQALLRELARQGIADQHVLAAIATVPRQAFVDHSLQDQVYENRPLDIGHQQTISQPYIVALMSQCAQVGPGARVLVVGTGCGYQDAILAEMGCAVYSIEIIEALATRARATLVSLGYDRVQIRVGDGHAGWPEAAPFDAIVVTAAPTQVPPRLLEQLTHGGRLVIPVGDQAQWLRVVTRKDGALADEYTQEDVVPVRFVPMTGAPRT